jgi:NAD+ kinase
MFQTLGIISKYQSPQAEPVVHALCAALWRLGKDAWVQRDSVVQPESFIDPNGQPCTDTAHGLRHRCDALIVIGGDGTLLGAGRDFADSGLPLLGVNQGRLGFLADVAPDELSAVLAPICAGEFVEEKRLMLSMQVLRTDGSRTPRVLAVNDVVLSNKANIRLLEFESWQGDSFISAHRADGMIVSTPTGSTAYALSSGGPIMHPNLDAVALVPICPHGLSDRPIVLPLHAPVRLVVRPSRQSNGMVTCDGQIDLELRTGDIVEISRASHPLRLIHPQRYNYFQVLRDKLNWGHDL